MRKIGMVVLFLGFGVMGYAQGEANFWYFGDSAGIDFTSGVPVAVTNGQLTTNEGCATVSDAAGALLFYTDGIKVWNRNHVQMPNGFSLSGDPSSTQSAFAIQKPGSNSIYYIFTTNIGNGSFGNPLKYSEVDMSLNGGLGDVTVNKNILLYTLSCEKVIGVRHCNQQDIWIITHDLNTNAFRTFLVTSAGVNTTPVMSNAGVVFTTATIGLGQLKASPDGTKLAAAIWDPIDLFQLYSFNASTGIISNAISLQQFTSSNGAYGIEFSPDGTKLYCSQITPGNIYQYDLCAGSNSAIAASGVLIGNSSNNRNGSLQLGPDNKIYVARKDVPWIGVINNPNTLGTACNFVDNGVSLAGNNSKYGLPNFPSWYFRPAPPPFTVSNDVCLIKTFTVPAVTITNCSGSANAITSVLWNFGDPLSGAGNTSSSNNASHTFTDSGTYTVTLVLGYACGNDTIQQNVTVVNCGCNVSASFTGLEGGYCSNADSLLLTGTPPGGIFNGPGISGNYFVPPLADIGINQITYTYSDNSGCSGTSPIRYVNISQSPLSSFTFTNNDPVIDFTETASNDISWDWNFGDGTIHGTEQNPSHTFSVGTYYVTLCVAAISGCQDCISDSVNILPTGINKNTVINNLNIYPNPATSTLTISAELGIKNAELKIINTLGQVVMQTTLNFKHQTLNISDLSHGLYYLSLQSDEGVAVKKFEVGR